MTLALVKIALTAGMLSLPGLIWSVSISDWTPQRKRIWRLVAALPLGVFLLSIIAIVWSA